MEAVMKAFGPSDRIVSPMIAGLSLLLSVPAIAIVGGAIPSAEAIGRSVITIVGSRGNFCTGVLIAPKLVLTVAHCVQPGAVYKIVDYGQNQQPQQNQGGRQQGKQADGQKNRLGGQDRQDDEAIPMQDRSQSNAQQPRR